MTLIISCYGIPSVIITTSPISYSIASNAAYAANGGGTNIMDASQPVAFFASKTSLNTGSPKWVVPAFLGLTPPTIFVPYSMAVLECKVPAAPVNP